MIKTINEFWGAVFRGFLMLDGHLLRAVDRIISLFAGGENFSMGRVSIGLKRGVTYICLLLGMVLVGMSCSKDEAQIGGGGGQGSEIEKVTGLKAIGGNESVILEWNKLEEVSEYRIYMDKNYHVTEKATDTNLDHATSLMEKLMNGQEYTFEVTGVNGQIEGDRSDSVSVTPRPESLNKPATFNATPGDRSVTLVWSKVDLATHYQIYRTKGILIGDINIEGKPIETVKTTTYTDTTGLTNDKTYTYQVKAIMIIEGEEEPVTGGRSKALANPRAPEAGRPAVARTEDRSSDDDFSVTLKITADANAESSGTYSPKRYQISVFNQDAEPDAEIGSATTIPRASSTETRYTINNLPYDTNLEVKVVPIALAVGDPTDDELNKKEETLPLSIARRELEAPKNLTATVSRQGEITLSWTRDSRATHYDITKSEGTGAATKIATEKPINELGATCCSYVDSGLKDNTVYTYSVKPYKIVTGSTGYRLKGRSSEIGRTTIVPYDIRQAYNAAQYVDPRHTTGEVINTTAGGQNLGNYTGTYAGATYPFGMATLTPVKSSGFSRPQTDNDRINISGFVTQAVSGMGCNSNLSFAYPFMVHIGDLRNDNMNTLSGGIKELRVKDGNFNGSTVAEPGYFRAEFDNQMVAEMTVSKRTGMAQFTLPASASKATFLMLTRSRLKSSHSAMNITAKDGRATILAESRYFGFCWSGFGAYKLYIAVQLEQDTEANTRADYTNNIRQGALVFDLNTVGRTIKMKYGLSSVGTNEAYDNLKEEILGWDFNRVKTETRARWNDVLGRVRIGEDSSDSTFEDNRQIFYTSLYRALLHPSIFSGHDGQYRGFNESIYTAETLDQGGLNQRQRIQYQWFSGWDTYRSQMQLVTLIDSHISSDMAQSQINNSKQAGCVKGKDAGDKGGCTGGAFTQWGVGNSDAGIMAGDPGSIMVANSLAFGGAEFRLDEAIGGMERSIINSTSSNHVDGGSYKNRIRSRSSEFHFSTPLELAASDFAKAAFAKMLKLNRTSLVLTNTAEHYEKKADKFYNKFNTEKDNAVNYLGRSGHLNDSASSGLSALKAGCYEGNQAQYLWMYPMNAGGIPDIFSTAMKRWYGTLSIGDRVKILKTDSNDVKKYKRTISALDDHLKHLNSGSDTQWIWFGNEPAHFNPFIYNFLGVNEEAPEAYKSQDTVRRVIAKLFSNTIERGLSGNDDLGAMTAWYVWGAMGLYPAVPGIGLYTITTPLFKSITIDKHDYSSTITLSTPKALGGNDGNRFIKGIQISKGGGVQEVYEKTYITHRELYSTPNIELEFDVTSDSSEATKTLKKSPSFSSLADIETFLE